MGRTRPLDQISTISSHEASELVNGISKEAHAQSDVVPGAHCAVSDLYTIELAPHRMDKTARVL